LAENLCKKQPVRSIDFSRFILPYGPFPLRLIRTDVTSKPPISTLIPRSGSSGATCFFYKLVSGCQKMSMSKTLRYYFHCRLDLRFSVRFVFMYMKPCLLAIFTNFWRSWLLQFTIVMSVRGYHLKHCHIPPPKKKLKYCVRTMRHTAIPLRVRSCHFVYTVMNLVSP
jgi:hypothetical protein